jgi:hypothetical protein
MFDPLIIIVTVTLVILVFAAYWIRIPYAIIPLGFIYLIFIIFSREPQTNNNNNNNNNIPNSVVSPNNNVIESQSTGTDDTRLLLSNIKPKPLVFDSGRTSKDYLSDKPKNPTKIISEKKKIEKKKEPKEKEKLLSIKDIQICQFIKNRNPIGSSAYFSENVDSLFCFTRMENLGGKQEVAHLWYYEDRLVGQVKYNIKSSKNYRSWTKKRVSPSQVGPWRVDVRDTSGTVLGSKFFFITDNQ